MEEKTFKVNLNICSLPFPWFHSSVVVFLLSEFLFSRLYSNFILFHRVYFCFQVFLMSFVSLVIHFLIFLCLFSFSPQFCLISSLLIENYFNTACFGKLHTAINMFSISKCTLHNLLQLQFYFSKLTNPSFRIIPPRQFKIHLYTINQILLRIDTSRELSR